MDNEAGIANKGIKGIAKLFGGKGKSNSQKIYIEIPNKIIMKYLPEMLNDMKEEKL